MLAAAVAIGYQRNLSNLLRLATGSFSLEARLADQRLHRGGIEEAGIVVRRGSGAFSE
jgi:hypothetical protein